MAEIMLKDLKVAVYYLVYAFKQGQGRKKKSKCAVCRVETASLWHATGSSECMTLASESKTMLISLKAAL